MCNNPVFKRIKGHLKDYTIKRPCGGCLGCRFDNLMLWTARNNFEWVRSRSAFVTFTYDDNHLFFKDNFVYPSIDKMAIHKYIDNLRHKIKVPFSYYGCSEYGGMFKRPHYHILFYGLDFFDNRKLFESTWKNGYIKSLPVLRGGVRYVCDYVTEHLTGDLAIKEFDEQGLERPYMSNSKGLGSDLFLAHAEEIADTGNLKLGSRVVPVPVYYRNLCMDFSIKNISNKIENILFKYHHSLDKARRAGFSSLDDYVRYKTSTAEKALLTSFQKNGKPAFDYSIDNKYFSSSLSSLYLEFKNKLGEVS